MTIVACPLIAPFPLLLTSTSLRRRLQKAWNSSLALHVINVSSSQCLKFHTVLTTNFSGMNQISSVISWYQCLHYIFGDLLTKSIKYITVELTGQSANNLQHHINI